MRSSFQGPSCIRIPLLSFATLTFLLTFRNLVSIQAFSCSSLRVKHVTSCTSTVGNQILKNSFSSSKITLYNDKNRSDENQKDEKETEPEIITQEMFLRDLLADPEGEEDKAIVKRKKKNGSTYKTMDNRDSLPFLVRVSTPDPYTNNDEMKREAKLNTENAAKKQKKKDGIIPGKKRFHLVGMDSKDSISSSVYTRADDGTMHKIVGEFALDKSTNCGDIIEIGDGTEYLVQKARCQYKYAGGKRFVMTRKILEVKEIKRVVIEQEINRLYSMEENQDGSRSTDEDPLHFE